MLKRWGLFALLAVVGACSSETPTEQPLACQPLQFRACETDACRGVQQCAQDGTGFGACACTVLDAGITPKDAATDGAVDAATDGADDAATDGADDAATDGADDASADVSSD